MHVEVRGQLIEVSSLLPPCGSQVQIPGYQAWQQVPLPTEPSYRLKTGQPDLIQPMAVVRIFLSINIFLPADKVF